MICENTLSVLPEIPPFDPETGCPVDRAKTLMELCAKNSCGHCVLCREGTLQISEILRDVTTGKGNEDDISLLSELCGVIAEAAGCEIAQAAANQCLELMRDYPEQLEQHIMRKRCPSLVCARYYTLHVLPASCTGCGECLAVCPKAAIKGGEGLIHVIDNDICDRCLACVEKCGANAIQKAGAVKPKCPAEPVPVGSLEGDEGGRRRRRRG